MPFDGSNLESLSSFLASLAPEAAAGVLIGIALIGALLGGALGFWLARRHDPAASRIAALEDALQEERDLGEAYRASVTKHFDGTSDLFRDMTRQYASLYAHLAEGARELSAEVPELGRGYADPALQIGGSAEPGAQPQPQPGTPDPAGEPEAPESEATEGRA